LVLNPAYNGKNFGSFLVSNSVKQLRKDQYVRALISYASGDRHVGYVYQASNWNYYGLSAQKNDFWIDGRIKERGSTKGLNGSWVPRPRKHRYALIFDSKLEMKWQHEKYPKKMPSENDCYGCNGVGTVKKREGGETECPICKGTGEVMIINSEVS
jgi:hypothetical protein